MKFNHAKAKALVKASPIKRDHIARGCGFTEDSFTQIINGHVKYISGEKVRKLAEILNVPESELWTEPEEQQKAS